MIVNLRFTGIYHNQLCHKLPQTATITTISEREIDLISDTAAQFTNTLHISNTYQTWT